jgi:hypothetical protein
VRCEWQQTTTNADETNPAIQLTLAAATATAKEQHAAETVAEHTANMANMGRHR